ncbi:hypothetical protein Pint_32605 [Pistacia integerrima]|uniref:Uncharacterized protein n=1 Tax=Pistacia integerrima TaxID=434235 RepID=A0ACC0XQL1_9ROSI|nr:hypothetical protein Pint_32605 [Pistacia integerrima]
MMSYSRRSRYSRSPSTYRRERGSYSRSRSLSRDVENPGNNLYVTGLSPRITKKELEKHFASEGKVIDVHLVVDPWTRESRGFGFVTMATVEEANRCIKYLDRSVLEGRVITVEKNCGWFVIGSSNLKVVCFFPLEVFVAAGTEAKRTNSYSRKFAVERLAILLLVDLLATLLTAGALVSLLNIPQREAGADLILRIHTVVGRGLILLVIVGGDPTHLIIAGADPTLALVHLTVGRQMIATIEGVTDPTLQMTPGTMTVTIEGEIAPTHHTTIGTRTLTIEGAIAPTPQLTTGTSHWIEDIDIVHFLLALHHLGGEALGEAIHVASLPVRGLAQGEVMHAVSRLDKGSREGATPGAYPQNQGRAFLVHRREKTHVKVTLGALQ